MMALVTCLAVSAPAHAAFPGTNGKLAFSTRDPASTTGGAVRTVSPDGTGGQNIAEATGPFGSCYDEPHAAVEWSPDGRRVAFNRYYDVRIASADGTTAEDLGILGAKDFAWSPDGQRIAFVRWATQTCNDPNQTDSEADEIWVVNVDGTGLTKITTTGNCAFSDACTEIHTLSWSPDGERLAYTRFDWYLDYEHEPGQCFYCRTPQEVWFADPDTPGSDTRLAGALSEGVDWSPNGHRLLLSGGILKTINPDGTGQTSLGAEGYRAVWSPDGTKIAYQTRYAGYDGTASQPSHLYTRDADGGNPQLVSSYSDKEQGVDWQAVPVTGYARPKGATPIHLSLVPASQPCTAPDRTHGPPLAFGSCAAPQPASGNLTVGTPDANGAPAKSMGYVRYAVQVGNPGTPADEADVRLQAIVSDVRSAGTLSDYAGSLSARIGLRITDKDNTPHPGGPGAATTSDGSFTYSVPCAVTSDTTVGSTCSLITTADAVVAGVVKEGRRSIWQLAQVEIRDGADAPFLKQGLFVP
jgi:hypothetical protein